MFWVGVQYRGIALVDIMHVMRVWFDNRQYQPRNFDYVISGSGGVGPGAVSTGSTSQRVRGGIRRVCVARTSFDRTLSSSRTAPERGGRMML
jgi:hypothetical protein